MRTGKAYSRTAVCAAVCLAVSVWLTGCGTDAQADTTGAETVTMPEQPEESSLTDISPYIARLDNAFGELEPVAEADLTYTISSEGATLTGYNGTAAEVVIPDTLGGQPVVAVAAGAFENAPSIRALCLPDTVTRIEAGALGGCDRLVMLQTPVCTAEDQPWFGSLFSLTAGYTGNTRAVPATLSTLILTGTTAVPDHAFYSCTGLEVIECGAGMVQLGDFAFYGCSSLAYVSLPDRLERIGSYAFANCMSLISLTIPSGVQSLGAHMLENCGRIESLTLPFAGGSPQGEDSYLGFLFGAEHYTLSEGFLPSSLRRVEILSGISSIPANAFYECSRIREILLPDTVTEVGHRAFYRCAYLKSINLPQGLTTLGDEAFSGCVRLTEIDLSMLTSTDGWGIQTFRGCVSLERVALSEQLTALPSGSFEGCSSLTSLSGASGLIPDETAFRGCPVLEEQTGA